MGVAWGRKQAGLVFEATKQVIQKSPRLKAKCNIYRNSITAPDHIGGLKTYQILKIHRQTLWQLFILTTRLLNLKVLKKITHHITQVNRMQAKMIQPKKKHLASMPVVIAFDGRKSSEQRSWLMITIPYIRSHLCFLLKDLT